MNTEQKDRLLKLAENNPDLAKDVVDILKADSDKSDAPVAVKVVKDEADKIEITAEQKKWVKGYFACIITAILSLFIFLSVSFFLGVEHFGNTFKTGFPILIIIFAACISLSYLCVYKAGIPTIKSFCAKHFKFT